MCTLKKKNSIEKKTETVFKQKRNRISNKGFWFSHSTLLTTNQSRPHKKDKNLTSVTWATRVWRTVIGPRTIRQNPAMTRWRQQNYIPSDTAAISRIHACVQLICSFPNGENIINQLNMKTICISQKYSFTPQNHTPSSTFTLIHFPYFLFFT